MSDMAGTVPCMSCGNAIVPSRDYYEVTGWARQRSAGGLHALKDRRATGRWVCVGCWMSPAHGQEVMF